jgi:hypothetical protein
MTLDTKIDIVLRNMNDGQWYPLYDFIELWLGKEDSNLGEDQILIDKMINEGLIKAGSNNKFMITPTAREINERGGWLTSLKNQVVSEFNTLIHKTEKERQEKKEKRIWQTTSTVLTILIILITARQCQQTDKTTELEKDKEALQSQIDSLKSVIDETELINSERNSDIIQLKNKVQSLTLKIDSLTFIKQKHGTK